MSVLDEIKSQQEEWERLANCIERIFGDDEAPVVEAIRMCSSHLVFLTCYVEDGAADIREGLDDGTTKLLREADEDFKHGRTIDGDELRRNCRKEE